MKMNNSERYENTLLVALLLGFGTGLGGGWIWRYIFKVILKGLIHLRDWHNNFEMQWEAKDMGYKLDYYLMTALIILVIYAVIRGILEHFRKEIKE